jgi:predicted DNA-binding ribbon-helix-helix protein
MCNCSFIARLSLRPARPATFQAYSTLKLAVVRSTRRFVGGGAGLSPVTFDQMATDLGVIVWGAGGWGMKSIVVKRSIVVGGHKTSVSLEQAFWNGLKEIASNRKVTLSELVESIDSGRDQGNLSSAIRLFVLGHYRALIEATAAMPGADAEKAAPAGSTR